jgi:hypothetical protein
MVHYYLGRPAHVWVAAIARRDPAPAAAAGAPTVAYRAAVAFPAGPRPAEPAGRAKDTAQSKVR